jgi:hypothetical protein
MQPNTDFLRNKLVPALLSGEFAQGHGWLRKTNPDTGADEWCCLGVTCEVARREGLVQADWVRDGDVWVFAGGSALLPSLVIGATGLTSMGTFAGWSLEVEEDSYDSLIQLNDSVDGYDKRQFDFPAIAQALLDYCDFIEGAAA